MAALTLIQKIALKAKKTFDHFDDHSDADITDAVAELTALMNNVTAEDVDFDYDAIVEERRDTCMGFRSCACVSNADAAPVSQIIITESKNFKLQIFVIHPGGRIPLHDHPNQYGFIKVIHGTMRVKSFSMLPDAKSYEFEGKIPATFTSKSFLWPADECITFSPTENNVHEIRAAPGKSAAFIDLFAPPYDRNHRPCSYYKETDYTSVMNNQGDNCVWLTGGNSHRFWFDNLPYTGPQIHTERRYSHL